MEIRYAIHPDHMKSLDSHDMGKHFLIERLFEDGEINMVYSHVDRIIVGGAAPSGRELKLEAGKELGVEFFLQRREMGIINIGSQGIVSVDGKEYGLGRIECLYIGMGAKDISFRSVDSHHPAKFYFNSAPAHFSLPHGSASHKRCSMPQPRRLPDKCNVRKLYQFIHPPAYRRPASWSWELPFWNPTVSGIPCHVIRMMGGM